MNDDYMLRIVQSFGTAMAKLLLNKDNKEFENIDIEAMDPRDILPIILKKLTLEGNYDKAENILFEAAQKNPSVDIYNIGKEFYNELLLKSDEELAKGNFSRMEIFQGLDDLQIMIEK